MRAALSRLRRGSPLLLGAVLLIALVAGVVLLYQKDKVTLALKPGDEVKAEFSREFRLDSARSPVKMAGVEVGTVTGVAPTGHGTSLVTMKLNDGALDKLGDEPSAAIRPTTLLGGKYYVDLRAGGAGSFEDGGTVPTQRTSVPVELDRVLEALPQTARQGIQDTTARLDETLRDGGSVAAQQLLHDAPGTLGPAGDVLDAARGTRPDTDLTELVGNVESTAHVLRRDKGQLASIIDNLHSTSGTLAAQRQPLADTVSTLPQTLQQTRAGLADLTPTLDRATATARQALPAARQLAPFLAQADPVLANATPLVRQLRPLLNDARPVVGDLRHTSSQGAGLLGDVRGPVLDRVNGPIMKTVMSPWKGEGLYQGDGGTGEPLFKEVAYTATHMDNMARYISPNGSFLALQLGAGDTSVAGEPISLQHLLEKLSPPPGGPR